jgi:hypothetical protein
MRGIALAILVGCWAVDNSLQPEAYDKFNQRCWVIALGVDVFLIAMGW